MAIPHKDCATDASSNFSSDETKSGVNTWCIHEHFCEIWREICKQMACKVARRSLCGIALYAVRKVIHFAASPLDAQVYEKSGSLSKSHRFSKKQNLKTIRTAWIFRSFFSSAAWNRAAEIYCKWFFPLGRKSFFTLKNPTKIVIKMRLNARWIMSSIRNRMPEMFNSICRQDIVINRRLWANCTIFPTAGNHDQIRHLVCRFQLIFLQLTGVHTQICSRCQSWCRTGGTHIAKQIWTGQADEQRFSICSWIRFIRTRTAFWECCDFSQQIILNQLEVFTDS